MLQRLPRVLPSLAGAPVDTFLLALLAVVATAAVFPATGTVADVLDVATKVVIALLFLLYGARLSPIEALHGLRHWRLHLLVLAATFVFFPILGLAARALVPSVLTPGLYTGVLFLCLVPSTVQSSIAFTSIANGNVPAAIVSASLSNILGVVLTPLLVVLLMQTAGGPRIDGSAMLDIVLQLLLPFVAAGGTSRLRGTPPAVARQMGAPAPGCDEGVRPRLDPARRLHRVLDEHGRAHLEHGQPVAGGRGRGGVRGDAGHHARCHRRPVTSCPAESRRCRGGAVLRVQEEPCFRPADGAGVLRHQGRGPDHVAADPVSPDPAVRLCRHREPNVADGRPGKGRSLVAADVDRVAGQQRQRQRLAAQHSRPQIDPGLDQNIRWQRGQHNPVVALDLALELANRPA